MIRVEQIPEYADVCFMSTLLLTLLFFVLTCIPCFSKGYLSMVSIILSYVTYTAMYVIQIIYINKILESMLNVKTLH